MGTAIADIYGGSLTHNKHADEKNQNNFTPPDMLYCMYSYSVTLELLKQHDSQARVI